MMKNYLVWGTGELAQRNYDLFRNLYISNKVNIQAFVDNDKNRWGKCVDGIPIISPNNISQYSYDGISIWSSFKNEIYRQLVMELNIPSVKIDNLMMLFLDDIFKKYGQQEDPEIQQLLKNMKQKEEIGVYYFNENVKWTPYEAYYDKSKDLHFIWFEGKKVFIKRNVKFHKIGKRLFYRDIWYEQDRNSPHLYEEGEVFVNEGDVIVDVGACEGNFSIHNIDKVSKAYVIECDPGWVEALKCTFEPYQDKVEIIETFVGKEDSERTRKLDSLLNEKIDFLKIDIEGAERDALQGATRILRDNDEMKCSICAYHRHGDERIIKKMLREFGFSTSTSKGYMLFIYDNEIKMNPELRRGIIRGRKKQSRDEEL